MFYKTLTLSLLGATALLATNGDNLIGSDAVSRAMGGVGIAGGYSNAAIYLNPAQIAQNDNPTLSADLTVFMPDVTASNGAFGNGESATSGSDLELIPSLAYAERLNSNYSYGIGLFAISGMGVDYTGADPMLGLGSMKTHLQLARLIPAVAYHNNDFRIGAGLSVAYGSLKMQTNMPHPATGEMTANGGHTGSDVGFGLSVGTSYRFGPVSLGAVYQTAVSMTYGEVYDFNMDGAADDFSLTQPAEAALGLQLKHDAFTIEVNYRHIAWSDAQGYEQFGWEDQHVFALGGEYRFEGATLRLGYSYTESPLHNKSYEASSVEGVPFGAMNVAFFNLVGFPAITEEHYSAGLSVELGEKWALNSAVVYAPEVKEHFQGIEASNGQTSVTIGIEFSRF